MIELTESVFPVLFKETSIFLNGPTLVSTCYSSDLDSGL